MVPATPPPAAPDPGGPSNGKPPPFPPDRVEIRLPSRADFLGAVRTIVRGLLEECLLVRIPEEEIQRVQIALQEACINVVRHAHRGDSKLPLVVGITARPDLLVMEIEDYGPGLPAMKDRPPDPDPANPREGGYGLFILRETMDEVRSEHRDGRHVLTLVKRLHQEPAAPAADPAP